MYARYDGSQLKRSASTMHEIIEEICKRPKMFTMHGTFGEVAAWLQGYTFQLNKTNAEAYTEWTGFIDWLLVKLNCPSNYF